MPATALAPDFQVNAATTGNQLFPAITALTNGKFVVTWEDDSTTTGGETGYGIWGRLLNADGTAAGNDFHVNTTTTSDQRFPTVASLAGGGFVVTWTDYSGADGFLTGIQAQIFDASGARSGSEFIINTTNQADQLTSTITGLANGGFVVTWLDTSGADGERNGVGSPSAGIRARVFDATGHAANPDFHVNTPPNPTTGNAGATTIANLTNGGFVITWMDSGGYDGDPGIGIRARIFNASGTAIGSDFHVNTTVADWQWAPNITGLTNGGFVISWVDYSGGPGEVKAQIFSATGTHVGSEFLVNTTTASEQDTTSLTALSGGGFVVTWEDSSGTDGDASYGIRAQVFSASGEKVGSELHVNSTMTGDQFYPTVTGLSNGGFAVTWEDHSGASGDIRARIFSISGGGGTPSPTITNQFFNFAYSAGGMANTADAGNDTLVGSGFNDTLYGADGNDSILGGAGHDDLNGNQGNDTVSGGEGNDWVLGGQGNDLVQGEAGNDIVYGNLGNDTALGGDGADTVRGGQGDDSVSGGAGNDWLWGDRGSDTISGGAGADSFHSFTGAGIDRVIDFNRAEGDQVVLDGSPKYTLSQVGADTVIDMGNGDQMVLVGVTYSTLSAGWIVGG